MSKIELVESLLADKRSIPWEAPPPALRRQVLDATVGGAGGRRAAGETAVRRWGIAVAAAVLIAAGWTGVYLLTPRPAISPGEALSLDPSPAVERLVQGVSTSLESAVTSEAQQFLDHADRVARNVIAQLPFTSTR